MLQVNNQSNIEAITDCFFMLTLRLVQQKKLFITHYTVNCLKKEKQVFSCFQIIVGKIIICTKIIVQKI